MTPEPWSETIRLSELRGDEHRRLEADEPSRSRIARTLLLEELAELTADLEVAPWKDGATVRGRWKARVVQICGVTLEPFETALSGAFQVRAVPPGSPNAPQGGGEVDLDLDAEDPPDVLPAAQLDLAGYVVEHLALEVDPYPRKPGVEFEPPPAERESSPFDVLRRLVDRDPS